MLFVAAGWTSWAFDDHLLVSRLGALLAAAILAMLSVAWLFKWIVGWRANEQ